MIGFGKFVCSAHKTAYKKQNNVWITMKNDCFPWVNLATIFICNLVTHENHSRITSLIV